MTNQVRSGLLLVAVLLTALTYAQQTPPAADTSSDVSPAKRQKIQRLIELTHIIPIAIDNMKAQMENVKKMLPFPAKAQDDFVTELTSAVTPEAFVNLITPVYAKYLSEEDLDGLIAYYQTPFGQKMLKLLPQITTEARIAGEKWGGEVGREIGQKIARKVANGDYGPWPPATPQEPKKP